MSLRSSKKNMNMKEGRVLYDLLIQKSVNGKLEKGVIKEVASQCFVSTKTMGRFWKKIKENDMHDDVISHKRMETCDRKRVQIDLAKLCDIPLNQRTNLRTLSFAMNVDKSTLSRHLKVGNIRREIFEGTQML